MTEKHTVGEFRRVFEQGVAPGGAAAFFVDTVWNRRRAAAPDGGTPGSIADNHAVAEQLREQLGIGRLAASGTGAGELEQRLVELAALDGAARHEAFAHRQAGGVALVGYLLFGLGVQRFHDQRRLLGRTDVRAVAAAHAIFGINLNAELVCFEFLAQGFFGLEALGSCL